MEAARAGRAAARAGSPGRRPGARVDARPRAPPRDCEGDARERRCGPQPGRAPPVRPGLRLLRPRRAPGPRQPLPEGHRRPGPRARLVARPPCGDRGAGDARVFLREAELPSGRAGGLATVHPTTRGRPLARRRDDEHGRGGDAARADRRCPRDLSRGASSLRRAAEQQQRQRDLRARALGRGHCPQSFGQSARCPRRRRPGASHGRGGRCGRPGRDREHPHRAGQHVCLLRAVVGAGVVPGARCHGGGAKRPRPAGRCDLLGRGRAALGRLRRPLYCDGSHRLVPLRRAPASPAGSRQARRSRTGRRQAAEAVAAARARGRPRAE